VHFSKAPGEADLIYGSAFFPWPGPVDIAVGDIVSVVLRADLVGEDYIWQWNTRVLNHGHPAQLKANFTQSTFFGAPLSPEQLRKRVTSHVPVLNEDGQIDQFVLLLMDGGNSLENIAQRVSDRFPTRFATWQNAMTRVGELSRKYSR
jgi:protein arginine N-methyltransferase 1